VIDFDAACIAKCNLNEPGGDRVREVAYGAKRPRIARASLFSNTP
jgi:hypothetical protein